MLYVLWLIVSHPPAESREFMVLHSTVHVIAGNIACCGITHLDVICRADAMSEAPSVVSGPRMCVELGHYV